MVGGLSEGKRQDTENKGRLLGTVHKSLFPGTILYWNLTIQKKTEKEVENSLSLSTSLSSFFLSFSLSATHHSRSVAVAESAAVNNISITTLFLLLQLTKK